MSKAALKARIAVKHFVDVTGVSSNDDHHTLDTLQKRLDWTVSAAKSTKGSEKTNL